MPPRNPALRNQRRGQYLAFGLTLFFGRVVCAQVTPVGTTPAAPEIVELSPFQVTAESDNGYRATSTLAGTRLKTDLKDIGAAVSVVTNEMMSDLGAVNLEDILVFQTGTEVGGISATFSEMATIARDRTTIPAPIHPTITGCAGWRR